MNFIEPLKKNISKKLFSSFLIAFLILAPFSQNFQPQRAEAQWAVIDAGNMIQNTLTAFSTYSVELKEYVLDGLAWAVINRLVQEMIRSTTEWVNSGFENTNGPAFVTDLDGFLLDIADQAAGEFISGGPLAALCSPFSFDITGALGVQYGNTGKYKYRAECTLSDVVENMQDFVDGDFYAGGWDGWASMTQNTNNNIYDQMFEAQAEMGIRIGNDRTRESSYLSFGAGFFSDQECTTKDGVETCTTNTPGTVIESGLNNALNVPNGRLQVADELDELFGALISQLLTSVLGGNGGLRGYSPGQNTDPEPSARDFSAVTDYRRIMAELSVKYNSAKTYCRSEFDADMPDSITSQYNQIINGAPSTTEITNDDVVSLGSQSSSLQDAIDLHTDNDCPIIPPPEETEG